MFSLPILQVVIGSLFLISCDCQVKLAEVRPMVAPPATDALQCGGKVTGSSGTISYKRFETVQPNERCVWILRTPRATSVNIQMLSADIPRSLIFTSLGHSNMRSNWTPNSSTQSTVLTYTNVLVVTFFAGNINETRGKGFSFRYTFSTTGSNIKASGTSEDVISAGDFGLFKYPAEHTTTTTVANYGNYDLSVFMFVPINNRFDSERDINVMYKELAVEICCDKLEVSIFNGMGWTTPGSIIGGEPREQIRNNDLIMLVFRTDGSVVLPGFHIAYKQ